MGNETGTMKEWRTTGDPRGASFDSDGKVSGYFPGVESPIEGAPSKDVFKDIQACR